MSLTSMVVGSSFYKTFSVCITMPYQGNRNTDSLLEYGMVLMEVLDTPNSKLPKTLQNVTKCNKM